MIQITQTIAISEEELEERFVRASGPGGQNVNKVSSAVELRFSARTSPHLPDEVAVRLMRLAGSRLTREGVIVIHADRFRDQSQNRADARARLVALIARAAETPKPRKATKPTKASVEKRLVGKTKRGMVKAHRGRVRDE